MLQRAYRFLTAGLTAVLLTTTAQAKPAPAGPASAATPVANPAPSPGRYAITAASKASFLIDAPLEKIKGRWSKFGGTLSIDPADLKKTRGEITIDLLSLKTHTFGDAGKDRKQGQHALNWMEVGDDVSAATREKYRTARFTITAIDQVSQRAAGTYRVKARGKLALHGRTVAKTAELEVSFDGPAHAPTAVSVRTVKPLPVSLKAHDIKPRDLAGRFLSGVLDKVGKKIDDRVQVTLELKAKRR